jgi:arsenical pump membrane protein
VFLARSALPWLASVAVTAAVVAVACRDRDRGRPTAVQPNPPGDAHLRGRLGLLGVVAAAALTLALGDPALPVFAVGVALLAVRVGQGRLHIGEVTRVVDLLTLSGVFLLALTLGTVARVWSFPASLMRVAGVVASAVLGAVAAVVVNNLPAAVLLGSHPVAHPRSLLIGLDVGPNLAVTGSLSALIWWQAARSAGARPSALRYSMIGVVLVPLTMAAALAAGRAAT